MKADCISFCLQNHFTLSFTDIGRHREQKQVGIAQKQYDNPGDLLRNSLEFITWPAKISACVRDKEENPFGGIEYLASNEESAIQFITLFDVNSWVSFNFTQQSKKGHDESDTKPKKTSRSDYKPKKTSIDVDDNVKHEPPDSKSEISAFIKEQFEKCFLADDHEKEEVAEQWKASISECKVKPLYFRSLDDYYESLKDFVTSKFEREEYHISQKQEFFTLIKDFCECLHLRTRISMPQIKIDGNLKFGSDDVIQFIENASSKMEDHEFQSTFSNFKTRMIEIENDFKTKEES